MKPRQIILAMMCGSSSATGSPDGDSCVIEHATWLVCGEVGIPFYPRIDLGTPPLSEHRVAFDGTHLSRHLLHPLRVELDARNQQRFQIKDLAHLDYARGVKMASLAELDGL